MIYPNSLTRFLARQAMGFLQRLREAGTTRDMRDEMLDFQEINRLLDIEHFRALDERYRG